MTDDFAAAVLKWWDAHGRKDFPWRQRRTPYRVWVAEVILQQTRASVAAGYFERFVARFPDIATLAGAELDDVLHLWSGLGYYARARNLHRAAGIVVARHGGVFPRGREDIEALPGIGRSTAGAIIAQAYGRPAAILDANVKRVLARHHRVAGAVARAATGKELWRLAESHTPESRAADYAQAIMDLGATVCRPRAPRCPSCPLRATCKALAAGDADRYPERAPRRPRRLERRRFFVLHDAAGLCYLERRPPSGIWGGLWSPPERPADEPVARFLAAVGIDAGIVVATRVAPTLTHGFSHYDLQVEPVYVALAKRPAQVREGGGAWFDAKGGGIGLSALGAKLLAAIKPSEPPQ